MEAIKFKDANTEFAKDQPQYKTLHALRIGDENDTIITCWQMSFWERIKVLFTGKIWLSEMNFKRALTPRYMSVNQTDVYEKGDE